MGLSKEARIGLLVVISLVFLFVGFYFLKGSSLFSNDQEFYCYYTDVDGLQNSANVQVSGMNVGKVAYMHLEKGKGVKVALSINKSIELPAGTVASLESPDLLGTKIITLTLGAGPETLKSGAVLTTAHTGGVVDNVTGELTPRLKELKSTISSFDTTLAGVNKMVDARNQQELAAAIHSIRLTADNMQSLSEALKKQSGEITAIMHNTNSFTANLARNNETLNKILANASNVSDQMANAPIQKTVADLQATITQFKGIAEKINSSDGTLGLLINNKDVYNNLNWSLRSLDSLMSDIKAHPKRYINVTVFGKGGK